ncbi:hypothetical protein [Nocardiopsis flavescens]
MPPPSPRSRTRLRLLAAAGLSVAVGVLTLGGNVFGARVAPGGPAADVALWALLSVAAVAAVFLITLWASALLLPPAPPPAAPAPPGTPDRDAPFHIPVSTPWTRFEQAYSVVAYLLFPVVAAFLVPWVPYTWDLVSSGGMTGLLDEGHPYTGGFLTAYRDLLPWVVGTAAVSVAAGAWLLWNEDWYSDPDLLVIDSHGVSAVDRRWIRFPDNRSFFIGWDEVDRTRVSTHPVEPAHAFTVVYRRGRERHPFWLRWHGFRPHPDGPGVLTVALVPVRPRTPGGPAPASVLRDALERFGPPPRAQADP